MPERRYIPQPGLNPLIGPAAISDPVPEPAPEALSPGFGNDFFSRLIRAVAATPVSIGLGGGGNSALPIVALLAGLGARASAMGQEQARSGASKHSEAARLLAQRRWENAQISGKRIEAYRKANPSTADIAQIEAESAARARGAASVKPPAESLEDIEAKAAAATRGRVSVEPEDAVPELTPAGLDAAATMYAKTGQLPPMGLSKRSAGLRTQIINRAAALVPGLDIASNKAGVSSSTMSLNNMQKLFDASKAFEAVALKNSDVMLRAMRNIPDTGVPALNTPLRTISLKALGSSELAAFNTAKRVVIPEFARLLANPTLAGQLTDEARKEIDAILRGDYTLNQMAAAIDVLKRDAGNRRVEYSRQLDEIRGRIRDIGKTDTTRVQRWGRDSAGNPIRIE